ncbi:MAG: hypothetical protein GEV13_02710 [Rhodospirillales bacterium]|nr:hypothetical protein [Rhodospirillales bacterium]
MSPPISYSTVDQSTFVDFTGYRITTATTAEAAYNITDGRLFNNQTEYGYDVALVLPRVQDPTSLLAGDWGSRQLALQSLNDSGTLWSTYGADQTQFDNTVDFLRNDLHLTVLDANNSNYVTSAESRTIWIYVETEAQFRDLFNTPLYYSQSAGIPYWNGELSLPTQVTIEGLWFDRSIAPPASNMTPGVSVTLPAGPQSIGNSAGPLPTNLAPQDMAALYNFPLDGKAVQTVTVGLIEPGIGSALKGDNSGSQFQSRLTTYLNAIGQNGDGRVYVQGQNGQQYDIGAGERSLDVGVVAGVNPNSDIVLFNGSGLVGYNTFATTYTAIQSATFEKLHPVAAWSDSFGDAQSMAPGSPFYQAYWDLFVDAALANQTALSALGDGGSGNETGNGLTNLEYNCTQPYGLLVGGSSLSVLGGALADPTLLTPIVEPALAGDRDVIWRLIGGGLTTLPASLRDTQFFVETVWNWYSVSGDQITGTTPGFSGSYTQNTTSSGGVDPTQPVPSYQRAYGLDPVTSDPLHEHGRGAPDVTANAGGNATYYVPGENMLGYGYDYGTSAASPLWTGRPTRHHLQRPGAAQPRLHERPALHRLGDRAGLVQRRHARQQHLVLGERRQLRVRWHVDHADRLRLLCRAGLRSRLRPGLSQRRAAGARAHRYRPFADLLPLKSRHARRRRRAGLDQRRRPEPAVPGHFRRRRDGGRERRQPGAGLRRRRVRPFRLDQPHRPAIPAGRLRSPAGPHVRRGGGGLDGAVVRGFGRQGLGDDRRRGDPCRAGDAHRPLRLCRFPVRRRRGPCGARGGGGRDGGRP